MLYLIEMQPSAGINVFSVQNILNVHTRDWYRFAPTSWIIITDEGANIWSTRLQPIAKTINGHLLVCKLDPTDRQGWMPNDFWDWIRERQYWLAISMLFKFF